KDIEGFEGKNIKCSEGEEISSRGEGRMTEHNQPQLDFNMEKKFYELHLGCESQGDLNIPFGIPASILVNKQKTVTAGEDSGMCDERTAFYTALAFVTVVCVVITGTGPMVTNPCESVTCEHGGVCTVQQGRGVCTCKTCPDDDKPVCGSNGITYPNLCKLEKENCELKRSVKVNKSHDGHCPGCGPNPECEFNSICVADSRGNAKCLCQEDCQQTTNKVCGTDGITYNNECELQLESCRKRTPIHVRRQGACGDCSNIRCLYNATCQNGRCICREDCPNHYDPVCGSDGETYDNECEMNREACITNTEISIDHQGVCDELSGSGSGETVCEETTCRFGGVCDFDAEGNGCVCKTDCPAIGSPVCGNDGKRYMSKCHLEVAMCKRQREIKEVPCPPSIACDGETPLVNPRTGKDYDCSIDSLDDPCPANSYCHKGPKFAKCCLEVTKPIPIP
ncbi:agrin-like, partial [Lingula anatina]|uniref:Agrin-like n=1 Tax=Lingula anatina TaxID=7574 RepID=A0A1S3ILQ6_LINAN